MFCPNCGKEIVPGSDICFGCGIMLDKIFKIPQKRVSAGWWWLGFFMPIVGLFLWIFLNDSEPAKAKKCGIGALVGTITGIVSVILFYAFIFIMAIILADPLYF